MINAALIILALMSGALIAEEPRSIGWSALAAQDQLDPHPFAALEPVQTDDMNLIMMVNDLLEMAEKQGRPIYRRLGQLKEQADFARQRLAKAGIEVEEILDQVIAFEATVKEREVVLNTDLEGDVVRIKGYLLPTEVDENQNAIAFLLVPVIGSCIHIPPPPPNQLVAVTYPKGIAGELFAPIQVTGPISMGIEEQNVFIVDGEADISFGYRIEAGLVEAIDPDQAPNPDYRPAPVH